MVNEEQHAQYIKTDLLDVGGVGIWELTSRTDDDVLGSAVRRAATAATRSGVSSAGFTSSI